MPNAKRKRRKKLTSKGELRGCCGWCMLSSGGRRIAMKNMYVGNLSRDTSEEQLREEFAKYGQVAHVSIIHDDVTHQSRGFGFVEMANDEETANAIAGLNGASLHGRKIVVNEARHRRESHGTGGQKPRRRFGT
jgi:cold-inducible RNA-binding protein